MCGIACLLEPGRPFEKGLLDAIEKDLFHRGPDSGGQLSEPGIALVFRRLAIMDPSSISDQPMTSADGLVSLVFNGEIYNFQEIRRELIQLGTVFRTGGDTEVVLAGYQQWGEGLLERLEGMFAFGLLDRKQNVFLAARDPLGVKPLYLARSGALTAIASEVRPLTRLVGAEVDMAALPELLTFGWAAGRLSNYRGIERVPGGTLIKVDLATGAYQESCFANPLETLKMPRLSTEEDAHEAVRKSVHAHLMSDVGYGLQLSGGVDSSLVVALASTKAGRRLDTYSVQIDDPNLDESPYREPIVQKFDLDHVENAFNGQTFATNLPAAISAMEGPVPHGGCVGLYTLCERIAQDHKVIITGEGADEMFGGYHRYAIWKKLMLQEKIDHIVPSCVPMPDRWPFRNIHRLRGLDHATYSVLYENLRAMAAIFPDLLPAPVGAREAASRQFQDFRDRVFAHDQTAYLESLLVRQDKMSMAHSLEARVPFVHFPLLRVVNGLPHSVRAPGGTTKPVLKRLADQYLPREVVHRRKVGLLLPYSRWASDPEGLGRYLENISDPNGRLRVFANAQALDKTISNFRKGHQLNQPRIFALINMEQWLRSVRPN